MSIFRDLNKTKQILALIGLGLSFLPGCIVIFFCLDAGFEGPNSFLLALLFMAGAPATLTGIVLYFFSDRKIKRKSIWVVLALVFNISLLPLIRGINEFKLELFLNNNRATLELIAANLLDHKWTIEQARTFKKEAGLPLYPDTYITEDETVLFFISGMIDNCNGIAYSRTGKEPIQNSCGMLVSWKRLSENWYAWATT